MTTVPFALSIHSFVKSVGADAGFAAIIGLAILVLLYFAQARETSSLREGLENADQWIEALESQLSQLQRDQAAAAERGVQTPGAEPGAGAASRSGARPGQPPVAPRPGGVPASAAAAASGSQAARSSRIPLMPSAPAGMAAPALAAATRMIPASQGAGAPQGNGDEEATRVGALASDGADEPQRAAAPAAAAAAGAGAGSATATGATTAGGAGAATAGEATATPSPAAAPQHQPGQASDDTILATPAPATAAALANGRSQSGGVATAAAPPSAAPAPRPALPASRPSTRPSAAPPAAGAGALPSRSGGGSRQLPPLRSAPPSQPSRARRLVPILIGLAVVVVIVVALLLITRNGSKSTTVHRSSRVSARSRHGATVPVNPASVTVAVLNGTSVTNLAHDVASRLTNDGYKQGTIATAADQTHSTTLVGYLPGHKTDARAVAAVLSLKPSSVQSADQQAMGVACPGASSSSTSGCSADVIVTVGSDLSSLASSPSG